MAAGEGAGCGRHRRAGEQPEMGVLSFIDNTVDKTTGTILCKATFTNESKRLWPGLFVNVVVQLSTQPNAILVSSQAVQTSQEGQIRLRGEARPDRGDSPGGSGAPHQRRRHHHQGAQARGTGRDRRPAPAGAGSQGGDQDRALNVPERPYALHRALHPPAGHDHPGHAGDPAFRGHELSLPAGERSAQRRFSHHHGDRQPPRGLPGDHGLGGGHPPGDASSPPSPAWTP